MANRTTPKKIKMGYELRINQSGEKGQKNWLRVGTLFGSTAAASEYRARKYPKVTKYIILGVRLAAPDPDQPRFMFAPEKKEEQKKGTHNAS